MKMNTTLTTSGPTNPREPTPLACGLYYQTHDSNPILTMTKRRIQHTDLQPEVVLVAKTDTTHRVTVKSSRDTRDGIFYTVHDPRASSPVSQLRIYDLRAIRQYFWLA
jgi:hypothetical protein